jgi:hypothetical protein
VLDAYRLSLQIEHADGSADRWGPDELEPEDIPSDLTFDSSIPGGDKTLTCTLPRRATKDYADLNLRDRITVKAAGNESVWQGKQGQFPRTEDESYSIQVGAVGLSGATKDQRGFKEVYADRDQSKWGDMPLAEKLRLSALSVDIGSLSFSQDRGLVCALPNQALGAQVLAAAWYQAPAGVTIAKAMYNGTDTSKPTSWEAPVLVGSSADSLSGSTVSTSLTLDGTLRTATPATAYRYALVRHYSNGSAQTPAAGAMRSFSALTAYGDHGLTLRAIPEDATQTYGIYLSDIVADIVSRAAPGLSYTYGTDGASIEQNSFVVDHLVFDTATTAEEALLQVNKFAFWEWGVYDGLFFFRAPNSDQRTIWEARLSGGAGVVLEGPQDEDLYNGVIVTYEDETGTTKTIGPVGFNCDTETDDLRDFSEDNPLNEWGEIKFGELEISSKTSSLGAEQVGLVWLAQASVPPAPGDAHLPRPRHPPHQGRPALLRDPGGDWVKITDHSNDTERRIIEARYEHNTRTLTAQLDNSPALVDALLEQMGVNQVGIFG